MVAAENIEPVLKQILAELQYANKLHTWQSKALELLLRTLAYESRVTNMVMVPQLSPEVQAGYIQNINQLDQQREQLIREMLRLIQPPNE